VRRAGRGLAGEKKQKLLSEIHVLVERWRPLMAEIALSVCRFSETRFCWWIGGSPTRSEAPASASQAQSDK
jgi:hypothetical protein